MLRLGEELYPVTAKFQSSPAPRCGCCQGFRCNRNRDFGVSILTRTEVRVLHVLPEVILQYNQVFQSSPAPRCGCCHSTTILKRMDLEFQSSPAPRCGCCKSRAISACDERSFNPHPHRGAGAALRGWVCQQTTTSFNPHPHRGAGAAKDTPVPVIRTSVSILTRTEVRVLLPWTTFKRPCTLFQSSPAPRCGCCP